MRAMVVALAGLYAIGVPSPAAAAPSGDADLRRGFELMSQGDYQGALESFRAAYETAPTPTATAQIGLAHAALENWPDAEAHLVEALSYATDAWVRKHRGSLEQALAKIRTHLGTLNVVGTPAGAEVRINREVVGVLPLRKPRRVVAGRASVEVAADGHETKATSLEIPAGGTITVPMALQRMPPPAPPPPPPPQTIVTAPAPPPPKAGMPGIELLGWSLTAIGIISATVSMPLLLTGERVPGAAFLGVGAGTLVSGMLILTMTAPPYPGPAGPSKTAQVGFAIGGHF